MEPMPVRHTKNCAVGAIVKYGQVILATEQTDRFSVNLLYGHSQARGISTPPPSALSSLPLRRSLHDLHLYGVTLMSPADGISWCLL